MPNVDLAKRRRIMQRSMKLGHCICDPRKPCPCDVFQSDGYCPCAGERPDPVPVDTIRLTERVHNAGCASKIAPADLETVLKRLPVVDDPAVISGMPAGDDAGVYRLDQQTCLVQTVDVMTPCVDDAETFGRICAANCLSDIYAMGGQPRSALSVLAYPSETLPGELMYRMMKGAMDVFAEADVALIGGHSVKDEEIKLGFAITGTIAAEKVVARNSARVGDVLVLTKPLGAGVLNFCRQIGRVVNFSPVEESMATLNREAAEAMSDVGISAATDVTGFGLFGHLVGMCRHSGVTAQVWADALPAFEGALEALADEVIPGAIERNTEYVAEDIGISQAASPEQVALGFDAQTSGGLLIAVPHPHHVALLEALEARGVRAWTIGRIVAESAGAIAVTLSSEDAEAATLREIVDTPGPNAQTADETAACCQPAETKTCCDSATREQTPSPTDESPCCCGSPSDQAVAHSTAGDSLRAFGDLMRSAGEEGAIDARTKEIVTFALVILARCEPCFQAHWCKARSMGLTDQQLEEAAWLAIAMGGAPVRMFYEEMKQRCDDGPAQGGCCG